jgi:hypothetical protein
MAVNYERLLRTLERELVQEAGSDSEFEAELGPTLASQQSSGPLRSLRFADDPDLQAVAEDAFVWAERTILHILRPSEAKDPPCASCNRP